MPDSAYINDPRVVWPASRSNFVAFLPDPDPAGAGRDVLDTDGGFTVQGVVDKTLSIRSTWGQLVVFVSVDEALRAVLGDPLTPSEARAWDVLDAFDPSPPTMSGKVA